MSWTSTEIKAYVAMAVGKESPLAIAAEIFSNIDKAALARSTSNGPPTAGTFAVGEILMGPNDIAWVCIVAGTPGTWVSSSGGVYPTTTYIGIPADPVADIAALKAVAAASREDKQVRLVESTGELWRFDTASSLTGDDIKVIAPTAGTGRWILIEEPTTITGATYVAANGKTAAQGADGSYSKPYSTIAAGLAAGGLVIVGPGTYTEVAPLSSTAVAGSILRSMGGAVTITVASGKVGVIAASRTLAIDGLISVTGIADSNAIELADGGGGAATTLVLMNGATVTGLGTGHGVAVLGKGTCINNSGVINASGTGNGCNLANNAGASYVEGPTGTVGSVGGVPVNTPALASATYTARVPAGCTNTGTVTVSGLLAVPSYALNALPTATGVPAGTFVRCTNFPTSEGGVLQSNGTKWVVKDFQPKLANVHADAAEPITAALLLSCDTFDVSAISVPRIFTVDSAANIVAALVGGSAGTTIEFTVYNGSGQTATIAVGAGGTLKGSGSVLAGTHARYKLKITNFGAPAYDLYRVASDVSSAAIVALAAGKTFVYGSAVIDPAAATDVVATGLAAIQGFGATLEDTPVLAEVCWVTASAAAGNLTVSGWTHVGAGDCTPKVGVGKAAVGTKYTWWAIGTV